MAEQIISPGVFTRENDLSFLPAGVGAIGAAIVGPTVKGPAFVPTVVNSFADYERKFGPLNSDTFVPQTIREYLKNAGTVTVCRVLAGGGYSLKALETPAYVVAGAVGVGNSGIQNGFIVSNYLPGKSVLLGAIYQSKSTSTPSLDKTKITSTVTTLSGFTGDISGSVLSGSFKILLSGSSGGGAITGGTVISASMDPTKADYLPKTLGYDAGNSKSGVVTYAGTPGYSYINFKNLQTLAIGSTLSLTSSLGSGLGDADGATSGLNKLSGFYKELNKSAKLTVTKQQADLNFHGLSATTEKYSYASTPFIQSGLLGAPASNLPAEKTVKSLFKFHTINHGTECNMDYKISITNLQEPDDIDNEEQYSIFSVLVRKFDDTDKNPVVLEQYNGVTLDPDSSSYIARKIGDRYPQYNDTLNKVELLGNYPNISNYVRVEVDAAVEGKATSPKLSPKGFAAVINPIATTTLALTGSVFPSASYESLQKTGTTNAIYSSKGYLGWKFKEKEQDNENWIRPLPTTEEANVTGRFNVDGYFGHHSSSLWSGSLSKSISATGADGPAPSQLQFSVPFQGGTDGIAPWTVKFTGAESTLDTTQYTQGTNLYGFDLSATDKAGYIGYKKAIDILSNQDEYDINMLALPGVIKQYHSSLTTAGIDMCEERGDTFFVMDLAGKEESVNSAVSEVSGLDTNYAAVYYPWVKVLDTAANKPVFVPPSVIVPGAIAASDRIGAEWFAPAGLNRGVLGNVLETKIRLNQAERDVLYNAKINPIATFPATGVCIWGQKTLQSRSTALDRINVRRLMIALKKFIASSSRYLLFEQNTIETRDRFLGIVNPYLESVQQRQGLYAFRVQMDEANNTPDVIDRNQLVGAIYLQPAKTAEFIILDFNVLPTGATFPA